MWNVSQRLSPTHTQRHGDETVTLPHSSVIGLRPHRPLTTLHYFTGLSGQGSHGQPRAGKGCGCEQLATNIQELEDRCPGPVRRSATVTLGKTYAEPQFFPWLLRKVARESDQFGEHQTLFSWPFPLPISIISKTEVSCFRDNLSQ